MGMAGEAEFENYEDTGCEVSARRRARPARSICRYEYWPGYVRVRKKREDSQLAWAIEHGGLTPAEAAEAVLRKRPDLYRALERNKTGEERRAG